MQTIGALKQFGLLSDEGNGPTRKIRLTNDALRIVLDKIATSPARLEALKRCFLAPKIFYELWEKYGENLPSDQTVLNHLTLERKLSGAAPFSDAGSIELLANYRLTMAFVAPNEMQDAPQKPDYPVEEDKIMTPETPHEIAKAPHMPPMEAVSRTLAHGERVVFTEEGEPGQQIKLIASGSLDEYMLDALANYIERQKRRLNR
jgi:hypothetical protein